LSRKRRNSTADLQIIYVFSTTWWLRNHILRRKGKRMRLPQFTRISCASALLLCPLFAQDAQRSSGYVQTNLVSSVPGLAAHTDANLVNAWGTAFIGPGPWWVNAAGTGLSILYDPNGGPFPPTNPLIVTIPPPAAGGPSVPTGIVSNTSSDFQIAQGKPALFLFASARGTISGWNPNVDSTHALLKVSTPGASYLGVTIGQNGGTNMLYAADFRIGGTINVFDGGFNPVTPAPGAFQDPMIPSGYAPFNVLNVGGSIYVMFAEVGPNGRNVPGPGLGYVDQFSPSGTLIRQLQHGAWMNSPWGIAMAPEIGFGALSRHLLVGNFGSGQIAAFDPATGVFTGMMTGPTGATITVDGLWGIGFGNGLLGGSMRTLYFAAGPYGEMQGLFGALTAGRAY
jgi:uncharacterized protein (TIGR03118 family)